MAEQQPSAAAIGGIDHALVAVKDLDAARDAWRRLGFTISPRGRHVGWGTANYTILFQTDYIELRGIVDPTQFVGQLDEFLEQGEGLFSAVLATDDAEHLHAWLQANLGETDSMRDLERLIEFEGREETLRFRLVPLAAHMTPGLHTTAMQHLTPVELRRPELLSHANGARSILEVTTVMPELDRVATAYAKLFSADAVTSDARRDRVTVVAGTADLLFVTPREFPRRHYDVEIGAATPLPRMAALTLEVADPAATALYLSGQNIPYEREPDGTVLVQADSATGVLLEFARRTHPGREAT